MTKLQLKLDADQTDVLIAALVRLSHAPALPDHLATAPRLASWLSWRREKLWGPSGGTPAGYEDIAVLPWLCVKHGLPVLRSTASCVRGCYLPNPPS
jgi:hypothetical protein